MKLALYALLSPLLVAALALAAVGFVVRGVWWSFMTGYRASDKVIARRQGWPEVPGGYHHH